MDISPYILFFFLYAPRNLSAIQDREICCYSISCKEKDNIGELVDHLNKMYALENV